MSKSKEGDEIVNNSKIINKIVNLPKNEYEELLASVLSQRQIIKEGQEEKLTHEQIKLSLDMEANFVEEKNQNELDQIECIKKSEVLKEARPIVKNSSFNVNTNNEDQNAAEVADSIARKVIEMQAKFEAEKNLRDREFELLEGQIDVLWENRAVQKEKLIQFEESIKISQSQIEGFVLSAIDKLAKNTLIQNLRGLDLEVVELILQSQSVVDTGVKPTDKNEYFRTLNSSKFVEMIVSVLEEDCEYKDSRKLVIYPKKSYNLTDFEQNFIGLFSNKSINQEQILRAIDCLSHESKSRIGVDLKYHGTFYGFVQTYEAERLFQYDNESEVKYYLRIKKHV